MKELVYEKSQLERIRKKDPRLSAMTDQWERMFGEKVSVSVEERGLVVRPASVLVKVMPDHDTLNEFIVGMSGGPIRVSFNTETGQFEWLEGKNG